MLAHNPRRLHSKYGVATNILQAKESVSQQYAPPPHTCNAIIDDTTWKSLKYWHLIQLDKCKDTLIHYFSNELSRLAKGVCSIAGTNTIKLFPKHKIHIGRIVTYGRIVVDYCPQKSEPHQTFPTVWGGKKSFLGYLHQLLTSQFPKFFSIQPPPSPGQSFSLTSLLTNLNKWNFFLVWYQKKWAPDTTSKKR